MFHMNTLRTKGILIYQSFFFVLPGMDQPGNLTRDQYLRDTTRVWFYRSYTGQLKKAIDQGANVAGYFAWSLLDNFEWLSGYSSKFGIVYIDFNTLGTRRRQPTGSGTCFRSIEISRAEPEDTILFSFA